MQRDQSLEQLQSRTFDVLVIGGGVTGAGAALDAAARGLSTALIEQRDWASGTSSRSSKLVHGGIRYLEQLNFSLVHEALRERGLLLQQLAPHLVRPIKLLYPLKTPLWDRFYIGSGMLLYDLFARIGVQQAGMPFHRHFSRKKLAEISPGLRANTFTGGLGYWDGQVDDARLVLAIARTAADHGATTATRMRAESFIREEGRITGVMARDLETGALVNIRAREVVIAGGVWTDELLAKANTQVQPRVRASKGVHIVVDREAFSSHAGLLLRTPTSVLFVLPWGRHWIIGTTDTDWQLDKAHPAATLGDIEYLLTQVNSVLERPLTRSDIRGVFAGLRPLLSGEDEDTSRLSREHTVLRGEAGLTVVAGGKLTTYRVMAEDTIDEVAKHLPGPFIPSPTRTLVLRGGEGFDQLWRQRSQLARISGLPQWRIQRLLRRYGSDTASVLELLAHDDFLAKPLPNAPEYMAAEIAYAATAEGALHLDDALMRRTRVSFEADDRGIAAAPVAADIMTPLLGWDTERRDREVRKYLERVAAEVESQQQLTDEAADRIRNRRP